MDPANSVLSEVKENNAKFVVIVKASLEIKQAEKKIIVPLSITGSVVYRVLLLSLTDSAFGLRKKLSVRSVPY